MTISAPLVLIIAGLAPILAVILRATVHHRRAARAAAEGLIPRKPREGEREDSVETFFSFKAARTPSFVLGRFTLPQRAYLGQQWGTAWSCFLLCTYVLFVVASVGLLPDELPTLTAASAAQHVWQKYLDQLVAAAYLADVCGVFAAIVFVSTFKTAPSGAFNRTRPLSFRFLFWARAVMALASLVAATQAALLASIVLLWLTYGPVWKLASVSSRFPIQLDLSMLTTTALVFSIFVFLSFLPGDWSMPRKGRFVFVFLASAAGSQVIHVFRFLSSAPAARVLFLFPTQYSPKSSVFEFLPLVCIAALLLGAERLFTRSEI